MDEISPEKQNKQLPFNNLHLLSGLVNGYNSSWMYFFTCTLVITGYVFFQAILIFPLTYFLKKNGFTTEEILHKPELLFDLNALLIDRNLFLLMLFGMFIAAFAGLYSGLRFIHHKTLRSIATGYDKFRRSRFWYAFMVWSILLLIAMTINYFVQPNDFIFKLNVEGLIVSILIMVVCLPIQTGLEELLFRGYLMQGLAQLFRGALVPLITTSILFGLLHMSNPEAKEFGWAIMLPYYAGFGFFLGLITLLDEGLELAFGIHLANNLVSSVLVSSQHSVIQTYSVFQVINENPYIDFVIWLVLATLTFFLFRRKFQWKNYRLILN